MLPHALPEFENAKVFLEEVTVDMSQVSSHEKHSTVFEELGYTPLPIQERLLLAAVLERALLDLIPGKDNHEMSESIKWFEDTTRKEIPFSFKHIASQLDLSAERRRIIQERVRLARLDLAQRLCGRLMVAA